jgi:hypothetical protein
VQLASMFSDTSGGPHVYCLLLTNNIDSNSALSFYHRIVNIIIHDRRSSKESAAPTKFDYILSSKVYSVSCRL